MNWREHVLFGLVAGGVIAYLLNVDYFLVVFSVFGSLAPDIDHNSSKIRKVVDWSFPVLAFFMAYSHFRTIDELVFIYALALVGIYHLIITYLKPKHRGITHTLAFAFLISAVVYFLFSFNPGLFFFIGYASHLLADREIKVL